MCDCVEAQLAVVLLQAGDCSASGGFWLLASGIRHKMRSLLQPIASGMQLQTFTKLTYGLMLHAGLAALACRPTSVS